MPVRDFEPGFVNCRTGLTPCIRSRYQESNVKDKGDTFSIIDKGMTVDGSLVGKGNLVVNGLIKGTLTGESVVISEGGKIAADTKVETLTVGGSFDGRVETAGQLVILATGKCSGEILCGDLVVEAGGRLDARVTCTRPVQEKNR